MQLTESIRKKVIIWFCIIFFCIFVYRYYNNGLLSQLVPSFFYNKMDFTSWLIQVTGLHKRLLNNFFPCLLADLLYYVLPFIYLYIYLKKRKFIKFTGTLLFIYNLVYTIIYCCYPTDSLEGHIALIVFPLVFIPLSLQGFWFVLNGVRYFFLFFFTSAGVWKLALGGVFNLQEMSGILLYQHKELLITDTPSLLLNFYKWLIAHPLVSYWLYFSSTVVELFCLAGFFTKKYDRILVLLYLIFLVMDSVVMRIDYWETLPFVLCLFFSKYNFETNKQPVIMDNTIESAHLKILNV